MSGVGARPCDPNYAARARVIHRRWTILLVGDRDPNPPPPVAMPLNYARASLRSLGQIGTLAELTEHNTLDGTCWTWEPVDDPGGPIPVQRLRTAGWVKPPGCVIVDRTSRWGNPHRITAVLHLVDGNKLLARSLVVHQFDEWLDGRWPAIAPERRERILRELSTLRGKDLACPCPIDFIPCHRDVLLRRANVAVPAGGEDR